MALLTSVVTRSIVFFGCAPILRDCSSVQPKEKTIKATTRYLISILRGVDKAVLPDPRHHLAQPRADLLDRQLGGHAPPAEQARRAGAVLQHELLGVLAVLDALQRLLHAFPHALVDDLRAGHV